MPPPYLFGRVPAFPRCPLPPRPRRRRLQLRIPSRRATTTQPALGSGPATWVGGCQRERRHGQRPWEGEEARPEEEPGAASMEERLQWEGGGARQKVEADPNVGTTRQ
jgi:hypothetical protein